MKNTLYLRYKLNKGGGSIRLLNLWKHLARRGLDILALEAASISTFTDELKIDDLMLVLSCMSIHVWTVKSV